MKSCKYKKSLTAWIPPKIVISENIGIFGGILKMGTLYLGYLNYANWMLG
jgi:hypothetical protein